MTQSVPVFETRLTGVPLRSRGKVRDIYDLGDALLLVATDRISAFDVVLPTPIPGKGRVLTQLSSFWFLRLADIVPHHVLTGRTIEDDERLRPYRGQLQGRSMIVRRVHPLPVECVVRGYLAGSAWREYRASGSVCGQTLPPDLREAERLESPLFTPATKATEGHDENIPFSVVEALLGSERARQVRDVSLALYDRARGMAEQCGLVLADTKFEFGVSDGRLVWIDEALTPDSSRYWPAESYQPGRPQLSFDKQYVRDYLECAGWNKRPPAPALPENVVSQTRQRYNETLVRLTQTGPGLKTARPPHTVAAP